MAGDREAQLEAELAFERGVIFALSRDLAAEWRRSQALLDEAARLRDVIQQYQRFTGGTNGQLVASDSTGTAQGS